MFSIYATFTQAEHKERLTAETAWISDVRNYQVFTDDFSGLVAGIVREKGWASGRIAMVAQSP